MELEEAIKRLENIKTYLEIDVGTNLELTLRQQKFYAQNLGVVLNHLTKQEKMIELMIDKLDQYCYEDYCYDEFCQYEPEICNNRDCKQCIKQYFEKKAEE